MSPKQLYGVTGIFLLSIACFLPLAKLNDFIISIIPVWSNYAYEGGIWNWRDISFFAVTLSILILLSLFFAFKKNFNGILITSLLVLFVIFIIFITLLQVESKASVYSNVHFQIGWGWVSLLPGAALLLRAGINKSA